MREQQLRYWLVGLQMAAPVVSGERKDEPHRESLRQLTEETDTVEGTSSTEGGERGEGEHIRVSSPST